MLVLSRKKDQKIIIGDDIVIMVVEIRGDKVRLGIQASKDIIIHREEVYEAIKKEQEEKYVTGTGIDPDTIPKGIIKKEQEENE